MFDTYGYEHAGAAPLRAHGVRNDVSLMNGQVTIEL